MNICIYSYIYIYIICIHDIIYIYSYIYIYIYIYVVYYFNFIFVHYIAQPPRTNVSWESSLLVLGRSLAGAGAGWSSNNAFLLGHSSAALLRFCSGVFVLGVFAGVPTGRVLLLASWPGVSASFSADALFRTFTRI